MPNQGSLTKAMNWQHNIRVTFICSADIDECESSPCVHGVCEDKINGYRCVCNPGYTGPHCEESK